MDPHVAYSILERRVGIWPSDVCSDSGVHAIRVDTARRMRSFVTARYLLANVFRLPSAEAHRTEEDCVEHVDLLLA